MRGGHEEKENDAVDMNNLLPVNNISLPAACLLIQLSWQSETSQQIEAQFAATFSGGNTKL